MGFSSTDLDREMTAAQEALDTVTRDHLGDDVEIVMEQLKKQFLAKGVTVYDQAWLRGRCAEPIANGQPVVVVENGDKW